MTTTPTPTAIAPEDEGPVPPPPPTPASSGHIGLIVAGSIAAGVGLALVLALTPLLPVEEGAITGAVLFGFASGWALLYVLSARLTDQPQRWALVPAVSMGFGGILLVVFDEPARAALSWVWPPAMLGLAIWMTVKAHQQLRSRTRRWVLYPVVALLALGSLGGAYETLSERADAKTFPMPGNLLEVSGHGLHLRCSGSGSPAVILQSGGGEMSSNMGWIAPAVSKVTRVCAYDRAGRGWSEPADTVQDGTQIARDLHTLLRLGGVPPPYVVTGHSFGGLYTLRFASLYPEDVVGMVLVDTTAPKPGGNPDSAAPADVPAGGVLSRLSVLLSISARLGAGRLVAGTEFATLPAQSRAEVRASLATAENLRSTIDEYLYANASMQEAGLLDDLASKPLVVLTAGVGTATTLSAAHEDLAGLSTNGVNRVIDGADHQALIAEKEGAAQTTRAILDVMSSLKTASPLEP